MWGMNQCDLYNMFFWKCHKESPVQLFKKNKIFKKDKDRLPQKMRQIFLLITESGFACILGKKLVSKIVLEMESH
jgi:hypothetical protein